jgi:hypothetical protein
MRSERGNSGSAIINHKFIYNEAPKNCANVVTLSDSYVFRPVSTRQCQSPPLWDEHQKLAPQSSSEEICMRKSAFHIPGPF